ncbi:MAG: hypothetical protein ACKO96_00075 [Flammeovirgaceae bacterium]
MKQTHEGHPNRSMQIVNLSLYFLLFVIQIFYAAFWDGINYGVIVVSLLRMTVVLLTKCAFLFLVMQFGANACVKTHLLANNDLLIIATDDQ